MHRSTGYPDGPKEYGGYYTTNHSNYINYNFFPFHYINYHFDYTTCHLNYTTCLLITPLVILITYLYH